MKRRKGMIAGRKDEGLSCKTRSILTLSLLGGILAIFLSPSMADTTRLLVGEDTDGSGSYEPEQGEFDPNDPDSHPETELIRVDSDNDGLFDDEEDLNWDGVFQPYGADPISFNRSDDETDPLDADTDDDGLSDYEEIKIYHTNPRYPDTDHDGLPDGLEVGRTQHVMISGIDYTYDCGNQYIGSCGGQGQLLVPVCTFSYYHIDHIGEEIIVDGISFPIVRNNFIADTSPKSITDPLARDTNRDGVDDGFSDRNANGHFDLDEPCDAAVGIHPRGKGILGRLPVGLCFPDLAEDPSGAMNVNELDVNLGDLPVDYPNATWRLRVSPERAGFCEPQHFTWEDFDVSTTARVKVRLFEDAKISIEYEGAQAKMGFPIPELPASVLDLREFMSQLRKSPDYTEMVIEYLSDEIDVHDDGFGVFEGGDATLNDTELEFLRFLNHATIERAYREFEVIRWKYVKEHFGGNTLNNCDEGRAEAFAYLLSEFARCYKKAFDEDEIKTRVSGADLIDMEVNGADLRWEFIPLAYRLQAFDVWQRRGQAPPTWPYPAWTYFESDLLINFKDKERVKRRLFVYVMWDVFSSPWAYTTYPWMLSKSLGWKYGVFELFNKTIPHHFLLRPNKSTQFIQHDSNDPEEIKIFYRLYAGKEFPFPDDNTPQDDGLFYEEGGAGRLFPSVFHDIIDLDNPYSVAMFRAPIEFPAAWDITRNHMSMDPEDARLDSFPNYIRCRLRFLNNDKSTGVHIFGPPHPIVRRSSRWFVDILPEASPLIGDNDGRIDHFLDHAVLFLANEQVRAGEHYCCSCCVAGDKNSEGKAENSLRDKVENRFGALFALCLIDGTIDLDGDSIYEWLEDNLVWPEDGNGSGG